MAAGIKDLRDRIASVKNTQKITEAMKLVAAAKVRRAQEAVVNGRPFSENLVKVRERWAHPAARRGARPPRLARVRPHLSGAAASAHPCAPLRPGSARRCCMA
jgi:ATP synthase F1 gamma subunit